MSKVEKSGFIALELKDLDSTKGTGVIRHSVYNSIDLANDVSTKGMFTKSWNEAKSKGLNKSIDLLYNHVTGDKIGTVTDVYEDNEGAYTAFKFGNWTRANDVKSMAEEGVLDGASFGYQTIKKEFTEMKSRKVRKLLEVKHIETSLLTVAPCHPEAGLVTLNKALEDLENDDITTLLQWNEEQMQGLKSYVEKIDAYCRKSKASDETIILLTNSLNEYKNIISQYDTALTHIANEPNASDDEVKAQLNNYLTSLNLQQWKLKNN